MLSIERPMSFTLRSANSPLRRANSVSSVVQTGVKSAGWEKRMTQLSFPCHSEKRIAACSVVTAVKSGAGSPMRGMEYVAVSDMKSTS
jgi:hypothetical protein